MMRLTCTKTLSTKSIAFFERRSLPWQSTAATADYVIWRATAQMRTTRHDSVQLRTGSPPFRPGLFGGYSPHVECGLGPTPPRNVQQIRKWITRKTLIVTIIHPTRSRSFNDTTKKKQFRRLASRHVSSHVLFSYASSDRQRCCTNWRHSRYVVSRQGAPPQHRNDDGENDEQSRQQNGNESEDAKTCLFGSRGELIAC